MKILTKVAFAVLVALTLVACKPPTGGDTSDPAAPTTPTTPTTPTYTVSFNTGGTSIPSQTVTKGASATTPDVPTKTGYSFVGWYTDSTFTTAYDFSTAITADVTVYANWTVKEYNVTLNLDYTNEDWRFDSPIISQTKIPGIQGYRYTMKLKYGETLPTPTYVGTYEHAPRFLGWSVIGAAIDPMKYTIDFESTLYIHVKNYPYQ